VLAGLDDRDCTGNHGRSVASKSTSHAKMPLAIRPPIASAIGRAGVDRADARLVSETSALVPR
jgi:hypothetical protein